MSSWIDQLRRLSDAVANALLPPLCVVCRKPAPRHLCEECIGAMARMEPPICRCCGRALDGLKITPSESFARHVTCRRCRELGMEFSACRTYGPFRGPLRQAIHAVKYRGRTAVVPALAGLLAQVLQDEPALRRARVVVPVPLHAQRLRERGFNQSELLARALAAHAGLEVCDALLSKVRHTRPQVGLSALERRENLRDAFAVQIETLPAGPFLLVDDVITTGSTFHECARALRAAGASTVYGLALAHD